MELTWPKLRAKSQRQRLGSTRRSSSRSSPGSRFNRNTTVQKLDSALDKQPADAKGNQSHIENFEDELNLKLNLETDVDAHITNQLPLPKKEEEIEEEGEDKMFSPHENGGR